jgi:adenylate cyclase class IV
MQKITFELSVFFIIILVSMIEKEVKLLDVPYSQLTQALCGVGATKIAVREIHDRYCDTPTGTLADQ